MNKEEFFKKTSDELPMERKSNDFLNDIDSVYNDFISDVSGLEIDAWEDESVRNVTIQTIKDHIAIIKEVLRKPVLPNFQFGSREKGICNSHPIVVETCPGASLLFLCMSLRHPWRMQPAGGRVVAAAGRDLRLREVASFRRGVVGLSHCGSRRFV